MSSIGNTAWGGVTLGRLYYYSYCVECKKYAYICFYCGRCLDHCICGYEK